MRENSACRRAGGSRGVHSIDLLFVMFTHRVSEYLPLDQDMTDQGEVRRDAIERSNDSRSNVFSETPGTTITTGVINGTTSNYSANTGYHSFPAEHTPRTDHTLVRRHERCNGCSMAGVEEVQQSPPRGFTSQCPCEQCAEVYRHTYTIPSTISLPSNAIDIVPATYLPNQYICESYNDYRSRSRWGEANSWLWPHATDHRVLNPTILELSYGIPSAVHAMDDGSNSNFLPYVPIVVRDEAYQSSNFTPEHPTEIASNDDFYPLSRVTPFFFLEDEVSSGREVPSRDPVAGMRVIEAPKYTASVLSDETYFSNRTSATSACLIELDEGYGHFGPRDNRSRGYLFQCDAELPVNRYNTSLETADMKPRLSSSATIPSTTPQYQDGSDQTEAQSMRRNVIARCPHPTPDSIKPVELKYTEAEKGCVLGNEEMEQDCNMGRTSLEDMCSTDHSTVSYTSGIDDLDASSDASEDTNISCVPDVDAQKRYLVDKLMVCVYGMFNSTSSSAGQRTMCAGSPASPEKAGNVSARAPRDLARKRGRDERSEDKNGGSRKRGNTLKKFVTTELGGFKKLACPYYKHRPQMCLGSRACQGPGWDTVHRLKYSKPSSPRL
jgi:hypothetical protein